MRDGATSWAIPRLAPPGHTWQPRRVLVCMEMDVADPAFMSVRSRLFGLAYRMLGSRAEAEDVVQDVYVRWHQSDRDSIENPEAWLVSAATNSLMR